MRSKASLNSHPIHAILVSFPVAFLPAALVFDVLSKITGNELLWQTGNFLLIAGIGTGFLAAIPGVIDYFFTVPPESSARARGAKHGLINVSHLILFSIALFIRNNDLQSNMVIALEVAGVALLLIAGWMGGTLVYRNQIGVDPRYAEAGKWKEEYFSDSGSAIRVAAQDELKTNQMKLIHIGKRRIVVAKTETGYVAFDDRCPHKGGSLAGGSMICGTVQCPWHGSQFDVNTGIVKAGPAKEKIGPYVVTEKAGNVYLQL